MLKKISKWFGWALMTVLMAAVAFVMVSAQLGWEFDAVLSGSMEPDIAVGGLVVVKPVDGQDVAVGDVISFKLPGIDTPICHRVIDRQETESGLLYQTMGDANEEPDATLVRPEDVNGRAIFYLPYVGNLARLSEFGRSKINILGFSVPVAALVITAMGLVFIGITFKEALEDIFRPYKKIRRERMKKQKERLLRRKKIMGLG